jgi:hypothetical protein
MVVSLRSSFSPWGSVYITLNGGNSKSYLAYFQDKYVQTISGSFVTITLAP